MLFESVDVQGGLLRFRPSAALRNVVKEDVILDYGQSLDLSKVPLPVLWTPGIYNMAAVVWLLGLTATVPFRYLPMEESLERIQAQFRQMYPGERWHGRLVFEGDEMPSLEVAAGAVVMFSGGVDSIHTVYRHLDERPTLVRLISTSMDATRKAAALDQGAEFAARHALDFVHIASNLNEFLKTERLLFADLIRRRKGWWVGVQYGMGTVSTAAPVAYLRGAGRVYIASSLSDQYGDEPLASSPFVDGNVTWPGTRVIHDAFDQSRQQKLRELVKLCSEDMPKPVLRVCAYPLDSRLNCGNCEKCLRTMLGLIVEGEAPEDWGFDIDRHTAFERTRLAFEENRLSLLEDGVFYWNDIRRGAQTAAQCPPKIAQWLAGLDLEPHYRRARRTLWLRAMGRKFVPGPIKAIVKPVLKATILRGKRKAVL